MFRAMFGRSAKNAGPLRFACSMPCLDEEPKDHYVLHVPGVSHLSAEIMIYKPNPVSIRCHSGTLRHGRVWHDGDSPRIDTKSRLKSHARVRASKRICNTQHSLTIPDRSDNVSRARLVEMAHEVYCMRNFLAASAAGSHWLDVGADAQLKRIARTHSPSARWWRNDEPPPSENRQKLASGTSLGLPGESVISPQTESLGSTITTPSDTTHHRWFSGLPPPPRPPLFPPPQCGRVGRGWEGR
jgi:hypothetical protein